MANGNPLYVVESEVLVVRISPRPLTIETDKPQASIFALEERRLLEPLSELAPLGPSPDF
jgi:hypothetical protein